MHSPSFSVHFNGMSIGGYFLSGIAADYTLWPGSVTDVAGSHLILPKGIGFKEYFLEVVLAFNNNLDFFVSMKRMAASPRIGLQPSFAIACYAFL